MNKNLFIMRLLLLPFLFVMALVPNIYRAFYITILFVRYGGEFMSYDKTDKATIFRIYSHLKNNQQPN